MKGHPNAKLLTVRWVLTEKARLVVREYNTWRTQEFLAATGNPMAQRVIPTIAVKRGYNTMVLDAVRAYLQVPEDDDVFIIPPAEWRRHDDFKAHSCWKAKTVWYGERHAAQAFQDFLAGHLCEMGGTRGKRDPTKFVFLERSLYLETHVDDAHCTGPNASMQWLYETLLQRGVKLKPTTILGQGQTYEYLQRRYTRVPEGMLIEPSPRYVEETLKDLALDPTSKGVSTPGSAKDLLAKDAGEKMLDATRAKTYASCVMRLVYLAQDRVLTFCTRCAQLSKSREQADRRTLGAVEEARPLFGRTPAQPDALTGIGSHGCALRHLGQRLGHGRRVEKVNELWSLDGRWGSAGRLLSRPDHDRPEQRRGRVLRGSLRD